MWENIILTYYIHHMDVVPNNDFFKIDDSSQYAMDKRQYGRTSMQMVNLLLLHFIL